MTTRFTIHAGYVNSNETNAIIYNTFTEVIAYLQAVCDFNSGGDIRVKIIDKKMKSVVYDGLINYNILADLRGYCHE